MAKGKNNRFLVWGIVIIVILAVAYFMFSSNLSLSPKGKNSQSGIVSAAEQTAQSALQRSLREQPSAGNDNLAQECGSSFVVGDAIGSIRACACKLEIIYSEFEKMSQKCTGAEEYCSSYNDCRSILHSLQISSCNQYIPATTQAACNALNNCVPSCGYIWTPAGYCYGGGAGGSCPDHFSGWDCQDSMGSACSLQSECNAHRENLRVLIEDYNRQCPNAPSAPPAPPVEGDANCINAETGQSLCG